MGTAEKFCLRWNDFETNISGAFKELRENKDFFDVTLACDDDQLQAHKVILSACSPFFRTILRRNHHNHPLLYLKGVKYADLVAVLNFMYHGEVNVAQEELNSFLAVAEDLKVKGLTQTSSEKTSGCGNHPKSSKSHSRDRPVHPPQRPRPPQQPIAQVTHKPPPTTASAPYHHTDDDIQEVVLIKTEPLPISSAETTTNTAMVEQSYMDNRQQEGILADTHMEDGEEYTDYDGYEGYGDSRGMAFQAGNEELDDLIAQSMSLVVDETGLKVWTCHLCNRTNKEKQDIKRHMEIHLQVQHDCPHCDKQVKTREALRKHIYRYHKQT